VSEPKGRETRENKLNQVQKSGLDVAEGEVEGPWVLAYFGTDVDQGESTVGVDVDGVVGVGAEGGDEVWGCGSVKVLGLGDVVEELAVDEFLRRKPDVAALLVVNGVLVRVTVGREARWGSKEVLEGGDVDRGVKSLVRERSGQRRSRGRDSGDGCGDDWQGDVLDGNVLE